MVNPFISGALGGASVQVVISAVDKFSKDFKRAEKGIAKLAKASRFAALGFATAFALAAKESARFEQTTVAFTTMLGSAEKATKFLKELTNFAKTTPFTLPGVEKAAKKLLAVGFASEEILPTLKAVGDVSSGLGLGQEGLDRLILNLGQVKTQGKLTGRELRDFAVAGVPLLDALADSMGKSTVQITEMVSKGEIGFDKVSEAFVTMSSEGGRFFNLMGKQALTVAGKFSNFQDSVIELSRAFGDELAPSINSSLTLLTKLVNKFNELPEETKGQIARGAIVATAGLALGGLAGKFGVAGKAAQGIAGQQAGLLGATPFTPMFVFAVNGGLGGAGGALAATGTVSRTALNGLIVTVLGSAPFMTAIPTLILAAVAAAGFGALKLAQFVQGDEEGQVIDGTIVQGERLIETRESEQTGIMRLMEANRNFQEEMAILDAQMVGASDVIKSRLLVQQMRLTEAHNEETASIIAMNPAIETMVKGINSITDTLMDSGTIMANSERRDRRNQVLSDLSNNPSRAVPFTNEKGHLVHIPARNLPGAEGRKQNDFVMRPGQEPVPFSGDDTIMGFKGGMPSQSITTKVFLDSHQIATAIGEANNREVTSIST